MGGDARALVLEVARPDDLQRLGPVEVEAADRLDIEARVRVEHRLGEVHLDPTERVHHVDEAVEVQLHEVLDRDAEVLFDRRDQLVGALVRARRRSCWRRRSGRSGRRGHAEWTK